MSCYSLDLRKSVINHLKKGCSIRKTASIFNISHITVFNWKQLYKEGRLKPKDNRIRKPQKISQEELECYIQNNPNKTLEQIANHFHVHIQAVYYRIKKGGIVYKKKNSSTKKEMKKKEKSL